jgi:DNA-3-methyladenine glycosylase
MPASFLTLNSIFDILGDRADATTSVRPKNTHLDNSPIDRSFFERSPLTCAQELLGCCLSWGETTGIIVETEAYTEHGDEASHAFSRNYTRSFILERPPGALYIYLNYGVHWLLNFLAKGETKGFVLIRALQPAGGLDLMRQRRRAEKEKALCSGPGKLTQALGITARWNEKDFFSIPDAALTPPKSKPTVAVDRRVGITKSAHLEWRFFIAGSEYVSLARKPHPLSERRP